ncbi:PREDICTED: uncharacterized protein LOC109182657 [Ipomoea nil]|uniref:uncharacterized protein LOC109182657 n=1 Tax=Ipomoea nil TaxID=35883 RepID=UPI0009015577|nr:PREDICTED: uncharacterized protein LOC109182657 [Ipomoea nil]
MSSFSDEVMPLAIGHRTSRVVWTAVVGALASSSRSRGLNLLGQLQTLDQGDMFAADYIGKARVLVEELALAGRPMTLEEQNFYVLRGLRPEFRGLILSLNVRGQPITLQELADLLGTEEFMTRGGPGGGSPAAFTAQKGSQKSRSSGHGHTASTCHFWCAKDPQANVIYQETPSDPQGSQTWLPDTGATNHATPGIAALSFLEDYNGNDTLRVGDDM